MIAGRVDFYFCPINDRAAAHPRRPSGRAGDERRCRDRPELPDVPTTAEAGYQDADFAIWIGLIAPAKTPKPVIEQAARRNREGDPVAGDAGALPKTGVAPLILTPGRVRCAYPRRGRGQRRDRQGGRHQAELTAPSRMKTPGSLQGRLRHSSCFWYLRAHRRGLHSCRRAISGSALRLQPAPAPASAARRYHPSRSARSSRSAPAARSTSCRASFLSSCRSSSGRASWSRTAAARAARSAPPRSPRPSPTATRCWCIRRRTPSRRRSIRTCPTT